MKPYTLGIAGASGSGKTTIANTLIERLAKKGKTAQILDFDGYYKDLVDLPEELRAKNNFDHPDAVEYRLLLDDLKKLQSGESIEKPEYDFSTHSRKKETEHREPTDIILVEGIFALYFTLLRNKYDYSIFINTDPVECAVRRFERDQKERGRDPASIRWQIINQVQPAYEEHMLSRNKRYCTAEIRWTEEDGREQDRELKIRTLLSVIEKELSIHKL